MKLVDKLHQLAENALALIDAEIQKEADEFMKSDDYDKLVKMLEAEAALGTKQATFILHTRFSRMAAAAAVSREGIQVLDSGAGGSTFSPVVVLTLAWPNRSI